MDLLSLGAGSSVFSAFATYAAQGLSLGRVATFHRDQYRIYVEGSEVEAEPSGGLWYRSAAGAMPVVGDWVAVRVVAAGQAIVEAVLPRRTLFSRRAAGRREDEQPIAANIDLVYLVCGLDGDFNLRRLERYLTLAAESGASPVIVLNKSDVCGDPAERLRETAAIAGKVPVVTASAATESGIDSLRDFLAPGRTVALLGSSGVGKSTIANRLLGGERLRTAAVRESDSRGRHTTTHRELMPLPGGGAIIDTPGMRELQLWAGQESVARAFEEIADAARDCRFANCAHTGEPGCAVATALALGSISPDRWESYRKLKSEARRHEEMTDPLAAQESKRKLRRMHKAVRNLYKDRA